MRTVRDESNSDEVILRRDRAEGDTNASRQNVDTFLNGTGFEHQPEIDNVVKCRNGRVLHGHEITTDLARVNRRYYPDQMKPGTNIGCSGAVHIHASS